MLRFSAFIAITFLAAATPAEARQPAAASSPQVPAVEAALRDVLAGFFSFRFFRCDSPGAVARLQAAATRFRSLHAPLLGAVALERAALIEAEMSVDLASIALPGCDPLSEIDRRLTLIDESLDRLGALLGQPPEPTGETAPSQPPPEAVRHALDLFQRFCLATDGDRARFDAAVAAAAGLRKTSSPFVFSGVEFNRRWDGGRGAELSFLDAPGRRSCGVSASSAAAFDEAALAASVAALGGRPLRRHAPGPGEIGFTAWLGASRDGSSIYINVHSGSEGRPAIEMGYSPIAVTR